MSKLSYTKHSNIFSPEEETASCDSASTHARMSVSKDTRTAVEALLPACLFLDSSPIKILDFVRFGMVVAQNNRINRLLRILEYAYNY